MKALFILSIIFTYQNAFAQEMAEFHADTNKLWIYAGHYAKTFKRIKEMRWKLNGKPLSFGSGPIQISANPSKFDTLLYQKNSKTNWDTIICNVAHSGQYSFVYNECCDGFNIKEVSTTSYYKLKVLYEINAKTRSKYLGTIDDAAMLVTTSTDTLNPECRSPLHPNIYKLTLKKIRKCRDTVGCSYAYCLVKKRKDDTSSLYYKVLDTKLEVLYMPLGDELLRVRYDDKRDRLILR